MKAVRLHEYDKRPAVEDVPDPAISDPHDVIVRIGGAGLCRTDLHIYEGQWAGGLGHIGIQSLAALTAAEMIVVDAAEPALDLARSIGAEHTVLADGSQVEQVMEPTGTAPKWCWTSSASRARRPTPGG